MKVLIKKEVNAFSIEIKYPDLEDPENEAFVISLSNFELMKTQYYIGLSATIILS